MLTKLEFSFLCACQESVYRQQELVPLLAWHMGVEPEEVIYQWYKTPRSDERIFHGFIRDTNWKYHFHGFNCDIGNSLDGRHLRVEFGPHGRYDTFSGFGILSFVMAAKAPWREFPELREFFAEEPPPYHYLSGSNIKMVAMTERLYQLGYLEVADKDLCALVKKHTEVRPDGSRMFIAPPGFQDPKEHVFYDVHNRRCFTTVLSELGKQTIQFGMQVS